MSRRGFINPHDASTRAGAVAQFEDEWHLYSSPSAAVREIAAEWGVGRTTLAEWVQQEGCWPRPTLNEVRQNRVLLKQVEALRVRVRELESRETHQ